MGRSGIVDTVERTAEVGGKIIQRPAYLKNRWQAFLFWRTLMKIKNEKGFTLIELMVVLVIIIVVIGLGIAAYFANLPHLRFTSARRDFIDDFRMSQQKAARANRMVRMTIRTASTYEIVQIEGDRDPVGAIVNDINIKAVDLGARYRNTINLTGFAVNDSIIFGRLGDVVSNDLGPGVVGSCDGDPFVVIQRGAAESSRICMSSSGRISTE
jgi:prepilin-type N-terminal cleavage/methylation domain-containing protein